MRSRLAVGRQRQQAIGCGIDVVELTRFRQALQRGGAAFLARIFTTREQAYARARRRTTMLHLAGRFAAKEAVIKAVSQIDPARSLAMNQIEIWFSVLARRLIRRGNFTSIEQLRQKVLEFIDCFNRTMAKPYKWTCTGRVLQTK